MAEIRISKTENKKCMKKYVLSTSDWETGIMVSETIRRLKIQLSDNLEKFLTDQQDLSRIGNRNIFIKEYSFERFL